MPIFLRHLLTFFHRHSRLLAAFMIAKFALNAVVIIYGIGGLIVLGILVGNWEMISSRLLDPRQAEILILEGESLGGERYLSLSEYIIGNQFYQKFLNQDGRYWYWRSWPVGQSATGVAWQTVDLNSLREIGNERYSGVSEYVQGGTFYQKFIDIGGQYMYWRSLTVSGDTAINPTGWQTVDLNALRGVGNERYLEVSEYSVGSQFYQKFLSQDGRYWYWRTWPVGQSATGVPWQTLDLNNLRGAGDERYSGVSEYVQGSTFYQKFIESNGRYMHWRSFTVSGNTHINPTAWQTVDMDTLGAQGVAECTTGANQCSGKNLQVCTAQGQWATQTTCPFDCYSGQCVGPVLPPANNVTIGYTDDRYPKVELKPINNGNNTDMSLYWPMTTNLNLKGVGYTKPGIYIGTGGNATTYGPYKIQTFYKAPFIYEGEWVTPMNFVKDKPWGYWDPQHNRNLTWLLINFGQHSNPAYKNYIGAQGSYVFDRDQLPVVVISQRQLYQILTLDYPPYVEMPQTLQPNPNNDPYKNVLTQKMQYSRCGPGTTCELVPYDHQSSWLVSIKDSYIETPLYSGPAKHAQFLEIGIAPGEHLYAPYSNSRSEVCMQVNGNWRYAGVREDWFFAPNIGPIMNLKRVFMRPDLPCIYDVLREHLTVHNADSYYFIVEKGAAGYEANYFNQLICSVGQTETQSCGPGCTQNRTCDDKTLSWKQWQTTPTPTPNSCPADYTSDGKVGVEDLLFILNQWGTGFGVPELLAVLNGWGVCS